MSTSNFRRVQHVSITRPRDSGEQTRAFYGGALGLTEIAVPESLSAHDLIWYQVGTDELHLIAEDTPDNTNSGRHFCIEVADLLAARSRLESAGIAIHESTPIPGRPRFVCIDPFGNAIELTEIHPEQSGA